jgi:2-C-methyl-D-erythritol 2,4-cyclodiphosphate synthase
MRVGQGYDLHFLVEGRKLVLGGVEIPFEMGLEGYSDGDALVHAVIDAVLGALSLGTIGAYFPSGDPRWKDANSMLLLSKIIDLMRAEGYQLSNLDSTVFADQPVLFTWLPKIREQLAEMFGVEDALVNVKAKTLEGLSALLPRPLMAASAIVALRKGDS